MLGTEAWQACSSQAALSSAWDASRPFTRCSEACSSAAPARCSAREASLRSSTQPSRAAHAVSSYQTAPSLHAGLHSVRMLMDDIAASSVSRQKWCGANLSSLTTTLRAAEGTDEKCTAGLLRSFCSMMRYYAIICNSADDCMQLDFRLPIQAPSRPCIAGCLRLSECCRNSE